MIILNQFYLRPCFHYVCCKKEENGEKNNDVWTSTLTELIIGLLTFLNAMRPFNLFALIGVEIIELRDGD